MNYRHELNAVDEVSRQQGAFIHAGDRKAISPVFDSAVQLYGWMAGNDWRCVEPPPDLASDLVEVDFEVVRIGDLHKGPLN